MTADLYRELGVDHDASETEIRAAARKRAQETHPDRTRDDGVEFRRVMHAKRVLTDSKRRAHYDAHGEAEEPKDERAQIVESICRAMLALIDGTSDASTIDLVGGVRAQVEQGIGELRGQIDRTLNRVVNRENALRRLKRTGEGENLLARMIEAEAKALRRQIEGFEAAIERNEFALTILGEYEYEAEKKPQFFTVMTA